MLKSGNTNINATSAVDGVDIAYFNASFSGSQSGNYTITKNIVNAAKCAENQAECDADYLQFEQIAKEIAANILKEEDKAAINGDKENPDNG